MSAGRADRNLLFGILAVQLDFVSRDQLIAAMNAWVLAKRRPLGDILIEQGALRSGDRDALETIVDRHLEKHAGDVHQSLMAQGAAASMQESLRQITDQEFQASLVHLTTPQFPVNLGSTRPPPMGSTTAEGLRYQILRPHARGGLGQVFIAHDCD